LRDGQVRRWSQIHHVLYRLTGGLVGRRLVDNDILLLTTTGRNSGRSHTVPLLYLQEGTTLAVIASYGGRDDHPSWYSNLVAEPAVEIQAGRRRFRARARTANPEERETWWPRVVEAYGEYSVYQGRTERVIPVVLLEPDEEAAP